MNSDSILQDLADRQAIVDLTHDYCWALDQREFDLLRSVFSPDVIGHLGAGGQRGVEEIIERVSTALSRFSETQHMVSTHQITIEGDEATGRCYLQAQHVAAVEEGEDPTHLLIGARYEDRYQRTADGWRIVERAIRPMWSERSTVSQSWKF